MRHRKVFLYSPAHVHLLSPFKDIFFCDEFLVFPSIRIPQSYSSPTNKLPFYDFDYQSLLLGHIPLSAS